MTTLSPPSARLRALRNRAQMELHQRALRHAFGHLSAEQIADELDALLRDAREGCLTDKQLGAIYSMCMVAMPPVVWERDEEGQSVLDEAEDAEESTVITGGNP